MDIPVIVVFTKYDALVNEHFIKAQKTKADDSDDDIERKADICFNDRIQKFKERTQGLVVKVSTSSDYPRL